MATVNKSFGGQVLIKRTFYLFSFLASPVGTINTTPLYTDRSFTISASEAYFYNTNSLKIWKSTAAGLFTFLI